MGVDAKRDGSSGMRALISEATAAAQSRDWRMTSRNSPMMARSLLALAEVSAPWSFDGDAARFAPLRLPRSLHDCAMQRRVGADTASVASRSQAGAGEPIRFDECGVPRPPVGLPARRRVLKTRLKTWHVNHGFLRTTARRGRAAARTHARAARRLHWSGRRVAHIYLPVWRHL